MQHRFSPYITLPSVPPGKQILFFSDLHLDFFRKVDDPKERVCVEYIRERLSSVHALFFLGDIFDFWFEYRRVIPKGYVRLQGLWRECCDREIPVYFFVGNHDLCVGKYWESMLNLRMHRKPTQVSVGDTHFFIAHGDGLGQLDVSYEILKVLMTNPMAQTIFRCLHPDVGLWLADRFLQIKHRQIKKKMERIELRKSVHRVASQRLIRYSEAIHQKYPFFHYFLFGHTHARMEHTLSTGAKYVNLGDTDQSLHCGVFNGKTFSLEKIKRFSTS